MASDYSSSDPWGEALMGGTPTETVAAEPAATEPAASETPYYDWYSANPMADTISEQEYWTGIPAELAYVSQMFDQNLQPSGTGIEGASYAPRWSYDPRGDAEFGTEPKVKLQGGVYGSPSKDSESSGVWDWIKKTVDNPDKLIKYGTMLAGALSAYSGYQQNKEARERGQQAPEEAAQAAMKKALEGVNDPALAARIKAQFAQIAKARKIPGSGVTAKYGPRTRFSGATPRGFAEGGLAGFAKGGINITRGDDDVITDWSFSPYETSVAASPITDKTFGNALTNFGTFSKTYGGANAAQFLNRFKDPAQKAKVWADLVKDYGSQYRTMTGQDFVPTAANLKTMGKALNAINWAGNKATGAMSYDPVTDTYSRAAGRGKNALGVNYGTNIFSDIFKPSAATPLDAKAAANLGAVYDPLFRGRLTSDLQSYGANLSGLSDPSKMALSADVLAQLGTYAGQGSDYDKTLQQMQDYMRTSNAGAFGKYANPLISDSLSKLGLEDTEANRNKMFDYIGDYGFDAFNTGISDYTRSQAATTNPAANWRTGSGGTGSTAGGVGGTGAGVGGTMGTGTGWTSDAGVANPLAGNDPLSLASAYGDMYGTAPTVGPQYQPAPATLPNPDFNAELPEDDTNKATMPNPQFQRPRDNPYTGYDLWASGRGHTVDPNRPNLPAGFASGGPVGGLTSLGYAGGGGPLMGASGGQADKIPAMLSDGEYVIDAETVAALGDGNTAAGAAQLDKMRQNIRAHKRKAPVNKIPPKAKNPAAYLKGR